MTFTFKVQGRMQALNDYISVNRGKKGKWLGSKYKKEQTEMVVEALEAFGSDLPHFEKPVIVEFHWVEINKKRDPDNFVFAKKFILDGMVKAGLIPNDGWSNIAGFGKETWECRPETHGGVIVTVTEV